MSALRRWDSDDSDVPVGPGRYDPTSSASSAQEKLFCSMVGVVLLDPLYAEYSI